MENADAMRFFSTKPFIFPPKFLAVLRGENHFIEEQADLEWLAVALYQDGKANRPYVCGDIPTAPTWARELMERFLWACWEQGRKEATGHDHRTGTGLHCLSDLGGKAAAQ